MKKITNAINDFALKLYVKAMSIKNETAEALSNTNGDAYIDTVVKILIAVVVGALILWALYAIMGEENSGVMGTLADKIEELFDQVDTNGR